MVKLRTSDEEIFELEEAVVVRLETVKKLLEECDAGDVIPVANVDSRTLRKVLEWCEKHADAAAAGGEEMKAWDAEFFRVDDGKVEKLFPLVLAANYLEVQQLVDQSCQTIADHIKDQKVEEVRRIFNIESDYTPEEEEKLRKENSWAHL